MFISGLAVIISSSAAVFTGLAIIISRAGFRRLGCYHIQSAVVFSSLAVIIYEAQ